MRYHCVCGQRLVETRKSTIGGVLKVGKHIIRTWSSTQTTVATSSGEAEFIAMYDGATRGLGMRTMMIEMGLSPQLKMVRISTDSSAAKSFVATRGFGKMRHLEVEFLWLQEIVQMGKVRVESESRHQHCGRSDQVPRHRQAGRFLPTALNRELAPRAALTVRTVRPRGGATRTPLQVELKGAPKPLAMTLVVGKVSLGQSTGDGAEEM